jgi:uncharacterized protein YlaI
MKILDNLDLSEIQSKLNESKSFREFLLKIGSSSNGSGSYKSIKNQLIKLGIEIPEFSYENKNRVNVKICDDEVFIENSIFSRQHLKERIIKNKMIDYKCDECGNDGKWNGEKLSLHLEHKNGVNDDNRLINLTFLCPNCHSQTKTYSGKNKKRKEKKKCECGREIFKTSKICLECNSIKNRRVERPTIEKLKEEVAEFGFKAIGRKYGVSDNAIRKWIKKN